MHEELEALFHRHQEAVLAGRGNEARDLLGDYEKGLCRHVKEEEDILLPLYRERSARIRGGDAEVFSHEHKKICEWLGRLKLRLSRVLDSRSDPDETLALLDDEAHYKKYLEHHCLREDRILYPELERVVGQGEKAGLLRLLTFSLEGTQAEE
jgi:hemerythrin-like domain-containing protein